MKIGFIVCVFLLILVAGCGGGGSDSTPRILGVYSLTRSRTAGDRLQIRLHKASSSNQLLGEVLLIPTDYHEAPPVSTGLQVVQFTSEGRLSMQFSVNDTVFDFQGIASNNYAEITGTLTIDDAIEDATLERVASGNTNFSGQWLVYGNGPTPTEATLVQNLSNSTLTIQHLEEGITVSYTGAVVGYDFYVAGIGPDGKKRYIVGGTGGSNGFAGRLVFLNDAGDAPREFSPIIFLTGARK